MGLPQISNEREILMHYYYDEERQGQALIMRTAFRE